MPKTLLQINTVVNSGSTGRIAEEIGQAAMGKGWRSVIAYGRNPRPSQSELIRIGTDWNVKLHGIRSRIFDDHGFGSRKATEDFIRKAEVLSPDVIHLHNIHGYYLNIEVLFKWLAKSNVPVVWTLHDCWPFTGHCSHFDFIGCEKWKSGCYACPQKKSYPTSLVLDRSRKNWEQKRELFSSIKNLTLVPVSNWLAGVTKNSFLGDQAIHRIYNGVNTEIFSPRICGNAICEKYRLGNRFVAIACAGAWGKTKGLDAYIELSKKLPSTDFAIVLVGIPDAMKDSLPPEIIAISRTESMDELAELYSAADVVLNLSYQETFGLTTVEGFACGTPGIVFNCTASPELITPETGFVVEPNDIEGVISAIDTIRSRGKSAYTEACRSRALTHFRKEDRFAEYVKLYEDLIHELH